jgi:TolA-binding protein
MENEVIKLLTIIAIPTITIVASNIALFMNLSKKIDNNNDRITKLEIELKTENNEIKIEIIKLANKIERLEGEFGIVNEKFVVVENRISEIKVANTQQISEVKVEFKTEIAKQNENTNTRFAQVESENKNFIKEITDKIFEFFQTQKPIL